MGGYVFMPRVAMAFVVSSVQKKLYDGRYRMPKNSSDTH
jgi:hypothetical protein